MHGVRVSTEDMYSRTLERTTLARMETPGVGVEAGPGASDLEVGAMQGDYCRSAPSGISCFLVCWLLTVLVCCYGVRSTGCPAGCNCGGGAQEGP